jgi:hypothetical protein
VISGIEPRQSFAPDRPCPDLRRSAVKLFPKEICFAGFFARAILFPVPDGKSAQPRSAVAENSSSGSGSGAIVVVQHAAQTLAPLDLACVIEVARLWADELVRQALMIALGMIMGDEVLNG